MHSHSGGAFLIAQLVKNPPAMQEDWVRSLGKEDTPEKGTAAHSGILAWRIHGLYSLWGCKESDTTERLSLTHSLELTRIKMTLTSFSHLSHFGHSSESTANTIIRDNVTVSDDNWQGSCNRR